MMLPIMSGAHPPWRTDLLGKNFTRVNHTMCVKDITMSKVSKRTQIAVMSNYSMCYKEKQGLIDLNHTKRVRINHTKYASGKNTRSV